MQVKQTSGQQGNRGVMENDRKQGREGQVLLRPLAWPTHLLNGVPATITTLPGITGECPGHC